MLELAQLKLGDDQSSIYNLHLDHRVICSSQKKRSNLARDFLYLL